VPAAVSFGLKDALRQKIHKCVLKVGKIDTVIPAGSEFETKIELPKEDTWLMSMDIHDVPSGVFEHTCIKDRYIAFEDLPIDGSTMELLYTIPFELEDYVRGIFRNVSDADQEFKLAIYYAKVPTDYVEDLKEEIKHDEELKKLEIEEFRKLSEEEKREIVRKRLRAEMEG